jgi:hypothetical protein
MITNQEEPKLIFFREKPKDLLTHPPLASSLQNLETSFLLIAMHRYPHALIACASAIESAIKAALKITSDEDIKLWPLIKKAKKKYPSFTSRSDYNKIDNFRLKRNHMVHFGFIPKDDEESATLLLQTGYNLIAECYETFFKFSLQGKGNNDGGLKPELANHLDVAKWTYIKAQKEKGHDPIYCFISFAHCIRWEFQYQTLSDWQDDVLTLEEEGGCKSWEFKEKQKEELRSAFEPSWDFDCPVCYDPKSFICELDDKRLDKGEIRLKRGVCVHCNLIIPRDCPFLADELCAEQIDNARPTILKEYEE